MHPSESLAFKMAETPDPQAARNVRFIELEESCKRSTTGQLKAKIASQGKSAGGLKGKSALIERVMSNEGTSQFFLIGMILWTRMRNTDW